jgi:hypothetical protein
VQFADHGQKHAPSGANTLQNQARLQKDFWFIEANMERIYGRPLRKVFFNFGSNGIGCVNLSGLLRSFVASGLDGIRLFSCLPR